MTECRFNLYERHWEVMRNISHCWRSALRLKDDDTLTFWGKADSIRLKLDKEMATGGIRPENLTKVESELYRDIVENISSTKEHVKYPFVRGDFNRESVIEWMQSVSAGSLIGDDAIFSAEELISKDKEGDRSSGQGTFGHPDDDK